MTSTIFDDDRITVLDDTTYRDVATVNLRGTVVAFARTTPPASALSAEPGETVPTDIVFNVLDLDGAPGGDANAWTGFERLELPDTVRPAGMNIINVPSEYDPRHPLDGLQDAGQPFRVLANEDYVYVFRQAKKGTLLVNRLRLVRAASPDDPKDVRFTLQPAWEARFQRSGKPDTPADDKDVPSFVSTENEPFIEPTIELFMIEGLTDGNFDVAFLPRNEGALASLQVFVCRADTNTVDVYSLPMDAGGLFLLGKKTFEDQRIRPDFSFTLTDERGTMPIEGRPSAAFYLKQERVRTAGRDSFMIKRSGRLFLAMEAGAPKTLATVDFGVAADGTLARPAPRLKAGPVSASPYTLEFDSGAYVQLPAWSPGSAFSAEFWIYPTSPDVDPQLILGNQAGLDAAPFIRLRRGTAIDFGVVDANGQMMVAETPAGSIRQMAWSHVRVSFDATASLRFVIEVNGSAVPTDTAPGGGIGGTSLIDVVGAAGAKANGFIGSIDGLITYGAPKWQDRWIVGQWNLQSIDYTDPRQLPLDPPLTPNAKDPAHPGQVFGAHLVPSTRPVAGSAGELTWDENGLTIYAAYFKDLSAYGELNSSPFVLAGADGRLHVYFRGTAGRFSVMHLDTEAARATFEVPWHTGPGTAESGWMQLVSTHAGRFMNDATVEVLHAAAPAPEGFCTVTLGSPSGRHELWTGVPRSVLPFAAVLAGNAIDDPGDLRVQTGERGYFDAHARRPAVYLPIASNAAAAMLGIVSQQPAALPLASVEVSPAGAGFTTVTLRHAVARWSNPEHNAEIEITWPQVPDAIDRFVETLRGQSPTYTYAGGMSNVLTYSLSAFSELVAANRVVLFFERRVTKIAQVSVTDGSTTETCTVTLALEQSGMALSAKWTDVPRAQQTFAATIQGENHDYDYMQHATGDSKTVMSLLVATTDGGAATVENTPQEGADEEVAAEADLRVSASLVALVVTAPTQTSEKVQITPERVLAGRLQSATFRDGPAAVPRPIAGGSTLFRAMPASVPDSGAAGLVADTATCPGGRAMLTLQGFEGGWVPQPVPRTLDFNWFNWVRIFDKDHPAADIAALAIQGDMSLELWCRPTGANPEAGKINRRLLTFKQRKPSPAEGDQVRYMAGLRDSPCLECTANTSIVAPAGGMDGTLSLWFRPSAAAGAPGSVNEGVIGYVGTAGAAGAIHPLIVVSIESDQKIHAAFTLDQDAPEIVGQAAVTPDRWSQVALTFVTTRKGQKPGVEYSFDVTLFVDGVCQGRQEYRTTRPDSEASTVSVGGQPSPTLPTLPMAINEVAFFERALVSQEVERYAGRRIPDNADGLAFKWMLLEGTGNVAINSAPTGDAFDVSIRPSATWRFDGLYSIPFLGHGDNAALLSHEPILREWAHLAMSHQTGHALSLSGRDYADCGNDATLNLGDTFAIEAWVQPEAAAGPGLQTVLAKGDDYALSITATGQPQFAVKVTIDDEKQSLVVAGPNPLPTEATYVAATYQLVTIAVKEPDPNDPGNSSKDRDKPKYEVHIDLYVNGERVAWGIQDSSTPDKYKQYDKVPTRVSSNARLNLGRSPDARGSRYLRGFLADVRLWNRLLSASEVATVKASHRAPANRDGLISSWQFAEATGRTAVDPVGQNNARLNRANLRVNYPSTAVNTFYVNGREAEPQFVAKVARLGGYGGRPQFLLAKKRFDLPNDGFYGQLDEVRIWARQLTGDQIADSMHTPLAGNEPGLRGYWNFDSGSGGLVPDRTGRGNDGMLTNRQPPPPQWTVSTAPLGNEAPAVWNMLGGLRTGSQLDISCTPSVVEYVDVERDAYGQVFSVMKRAYVAVIDGAIAFVTGFKIGDLDTVYLGQAQSKPTLVGFIEGAPPIPSENQTLPSWRSGFGGIQAYSGAASVTFQEADDTTYTFKSDRGTSDTHKITLKAGAEGKLDIDFSKGLGLEVGSRVLKIEGKVGGQFGYEAVRRLNRGVDVQTGTKGTLATTLSPGGAWEPGTTPGEWVNPVVGRRFVPNNTGLAVVKSLTVDLVASIIRTTGATVKITAVPNPDIPEDVNLIDFPINPLYVKNGTLDGKVGLANDPDYPNADLERGSYFRPIEAYAIKRRLERADAQLEASYQQYDEGQRAGRLKSAGNWKAFLSASRDTGGYDWARHLAKRSIVNTYVWTAGGGSYAEQTQPVNVYTESHGAIASETFSGGVNLSVKGIYVVAGAYLDFDYLFSSATAVTVIKTKAEGASFALAAKASPDAYLYAPRIGGNGDVTFANAPTEGKVDGYRYMAIFAAPNEDHADTFFREVVDLQWLQNSRDPSAAALRQARGAGNGPWRVLYRVTYVSRIPPKFQPAPAETLPPDVQPPANLAYNALLVQLVRGQIPAARPTPLEIGQAIAKVIGTPEAPGLLRHALPWWPELLSDSTKYRLPAAAILRELREDLLQYMIDDYATREADADADAGGTEDEAPAAAALAADVVAV